MIGYGHGGKKSLVNTKHKTAERSECWPDRVSFDNFKDPSSASTSANEGVIESIVHFYGHNVNTYCNYPTEYPKPKKSKKKVTKESETTKDRNENTEGDQEAET